MDSIGSFRPHGIGRVQKASMIGFVGLSHLGIVSSIAAASKTKEGVVAFDPDAVLCEKLEGGECPVYEPGLSELLKSFREQIKFTSDMANLKKCSLIILSPDTPTDSENRADLSTLHRLFEGLVNLLSNCAALVVLSQVPPGLTRALSEKTKRTAGFHPPHIYHQVETLVFGNAVERALKPERFIVGCADPAAALSPVYEAYLKEFGCPIFKMKYESAELAKMAINVCLAASLSAANSLAEICEHLDADWREIEPALRTDRRIGPHAYLSAGLGIAGGNIERDLVAVRELARTLGADSGVTEAFLANSRHRKNWALKTIHELVDLSDPGVTIALWGLAYKADTKSTKNSPALGLLENLSRFSVRVYDPQALLDKKVFPNAVQAESVLDACRGADALVIMTPWKEFSSVPLARLKEALKPSSVVVDPFGVLDRKECAKLGLRYFRLGSKA